MPAGRTVDVVKGGPPTAHDVTTRLAAIGVFRSGIEWLERLGALGKEFWTFFGASFCFDLGGFVFFVLFNVYLLDCGFSEKTIGLVASATGIGTVAGTLPAGLLAQRFGLRRTMLLCFALVPAIYALRGLLISHAAQFVLAALGGAAMAIWAVCLSPAIAQLTDDANRPSAFSLVFSTGIGVGVLGGVLGGYLPATVTRIFPATSHGSSLKLALIIAGGIVALGAWPVCNLKSLSAPALEQKTYPSSRFLFRFLLAIALWSLVTGSLGPFVNVYFSRQLHLPVSRIGVVVSIAQLSQVLAILLAPMIYRRFGLISGIMYTQFATAFSLACLALVPAASAAAAIYTVYMAVQWMSEPGMYSLLMTSVPASQRSGASALNFFVISLASAVAAALAGQGFARFGYPPVIACMAVMAVIAAIAFRALLGEAGVDQAVPSVISAARGAE